MRKTFALILAITLVFSMFAITGCGNNNTAPEPPPRSTNNDPAGNKTENPAEPTEPTPPAETPTEQRPADPNPPPPTPAPRPEQNPPARPQTPPEGGVLMRGTWNGRTYTSDYLGLSLTTPAGWTVATDQEIAAVMGVGMDFMQEFSSGIIPDAFWNMAMATMIIDVVTANPNGDSIQIAFERLTFPHTEMTELEYIQHSVALLEEFGLEIDPRNLGQTIQIGNNTWYRISSEWDFGMIVIIQNMYVNISDGMARLLTITTDNLGLGPDHDEIMNWFRPLNAGV
jgi:hypothetical protein